MHQKKTETLYTAAQRFLTIKRAQKISDVTLNDYERQLPRFIESTSNDLRMEKLEPETLAYFSAIPNTSPARYNKPYQYISAWFNWMVKNGYIPYNPLKQNEIKKRRDDGNIHPIRPEELRIWLDSIKRGSFLAERTYVTACIILDCGIRTSELLRLRNSAFSSDAGILSINKNISKTKQNRRVFLSPPTVILLQQFIKFKPSGWEPWLIPNYRGGQLTTTYLDKAFRRVSLACGICVTPYQLRHTFATLYLRNGGDLFSLQKQMGHNDLRTTKRYTEVDDDFLQLQHQQFSPMKLLDI